MAASALCAAALLAAPRVAAAQQGAAVPASAPLVAPDSSPPFERPNGALLRAGTFVYRLTLLRPGVPDTPLGVRTVQVADAPAGGVPGWLIAESRTGSAVPTSDSLWVTRADLSPERWAATVDRTQLGASFSRDSVFGALQSYQGRSSFAAAVPPGSLITSGMVERVVEMLPLRVGYRVSAWLLLLDMGVARALPAELSVEREERARVGGMEVNCWLVVLRAGVMEERLWVSRDGSRVVATEQVVGAGVLRGELAH